MKLIYGEKGTGKTKIIINEANEKVEEAKGHLVFITDTKRYMYDLKRPVRFIDISDFGVVNEDTLFGFINGIVAGNSDNEFIYIDGVARITGKNLADMKDFFEKTEILSERFSVKFVFTCSIAKEELPDFLKKYV